MLIIRTPFDVSYGCPNITAYMTSEGNGLLLIKLRHTGLTLTQSWSTANVLNTKLELDNNIAKGLKAEALTVRTI